jgi:hypothetical protein
MDLRKSRWERFFSTLKTQRLSRRVYQFRGEFRADLFDYIERFYNGTAQAINIRIRQPRYNSRWRLLRLTNVSREDGQTQNVIGGNNVKHWDLRSTACCPPSGRSAPSSRSPAGEEKPSAIRCDTSREYRSGPIVERPAPAASSFNPSSPATRGTTSIWDG